MLFTTVRLVSVRGSCPEVFCNKGILYAKLIGKHLCQSLFFNKVVCLRPAILLKKGLWHRCFPIKFAKFSRTNFFHRTTPVTLSVLCDV